MDYTALTYKTFDMDQTFLVSLAERTVFSVQISQNPKPFKTCIVNI